MRYRAKLTSLVLNFQRTGRSTKQSKISETDNTIKESGY